MTNIPLMPHLLTHSLKSLLQVLTQHFLLKSPPFLPLLKTKSPLPEKPMLDGKIEKLQLGLKN